MLSKPAPRRLGAMLLVMAAAAIGPGAVAQASAADFSPTAGAYTVDTTALTLSGPGTNVTGTVQGGVAVFSFDNVNIAAGVSIVVHGSRPFELRAAGNFGLAGLIDGSGTSATALAAGPNAGGPGAGAGGADGTQAGGGPGGGGRGSSASDGGGGGGFGGAGAAGGSDVGAGGAGGSAYGDLNLTLQGGSGGAGATTGSGAVGGGGGGGAIAIAASTVTIAPTGEVRVNGGNGAGGSAGASGGGSGGAIMLRANTLSVAGALNANGGAGANSSCCGAGGGGGGGRVALQYRTLVSPGRVSVTGGASGTSVHASSQAAGAIGAVTQTRVESTTAIPGVPTITLRIGSTNVLSATAAGLTGTVVPVGTSTTSYFEYGTSPRLGQTTAAHTISGTQAVSVSALLTGLRPGATYYYRLVAKSLGVTITSPVRTFHTHAAIVVSGIRSVGLTTTSSVVIRIHATSHAAIRHIVVLIGHHTIAISNRSSLTLRKTLQGLKPGLHTLTVRVTSAHGTTTHTLHFRVSAAATAPSFTG